MIDDNPDGREMLRCLCELYGYREVARRIRAELGAATPRLVALSGYGSLERRARALEAGFDAQIAKPIDVVHLRREMAAAKKW